MRVLVCGDRNWKDQSTIFEKLNDIHKHHTITTIICGGCTGADFIAEKWAESVGVNEILIFPANWKTYGRSAGPIRNKRMIVEGIPDLVVAFHSDIENSKGTKNMVEQAKKSNIYIDIIHK